MKKVKVINIIHLLVTIFILLLVPVEGKGYFRKKVIGFKSFSLGGGGFFYSFNSRNIGDFISSQLRFMFTFFDPGIGFGINIGAYQFSLLSDDYKDSIPIFHPYLVFSKHIANQVQIFLYGGGGFIRFQCVKGLCDDPQPVNGWGGEAEAGLGIALAKFLSLEGGVNWGFPPSPFDNFRNLFMRVTTGYFSSRYRSVENPSLEISSIKFSDRNGDGVLEVGEDGAIIVRLYNSGRIPAENTTVYLLEGLKGLFDVLSLKYKEVEVGVIDKDIYKDVVFSVGIKESVDLSRIIIPEECVIYAYAECKDCEKVKSSVSLKLSSKRFLEKKEEAEIQRVGEIEKPVEMGIPTPLYLEEKIEEPVPHFQPKGVTAVIGKVNLDDSEGNNNGVLEFGEQAFLKVEIIPDFSQSFTAFASPVKSPYCFTITENQQSLVQKEDKHILLIPIKLVSKCPLQSTDVNLGVSVYPEGEEPILLGASARINTAVRCGIPHEKCWVLIKVKGRYKETVYSSASDAVEGRKNVALVDEHTIGERINRCIEGVNLSGINIGTEIEQLKLLGIRWSMEIKVETIKKGLLNLAKMCIYEVEVHSNLYEVSERGFSELHRSGKSKCFLVEPTSTDISEIVRSTVLELLNRVECR